MNNFTPTILHADIMQPIDLNTFRFKSGGDMTNVYRSVMNRYASKYGIDPNLFAGNLRAEGFNYHQNEITDNLVNNPSYTKQNRATIKKQQYPISGAEYMGLDINESTIDRLIRKGLLSKDLKNNIKFAKTELEKGVKSTAHFNDLDSAMEVYGAVMKDRKDAVNKYARDLNIDLSDEDMNYLIANAYNRGQGATKKLMQEAKDSNYKSVSKYAVDNKSYSGDILKRTRSVGTDNVSYMLPGVTVSAKRDNFNYSQPIDNTYTNVNKAIGVTGYLPTVDVVGYNTRRTKPNIPEESRMIDYDVNDYPFSPEPNLPLPVGIGALRSLKLAKALKPRPNVDMIGIMNNNFVTTPKQAPFNNYAPMRNKGENLSFRYNDSTRGSKGTFPSYYKSGGYTVSRSNRKGKTHKVTGPDGTVKHFGDPNLKNKPNDPKAKKAWYARHAKSLKNNPHFRAYARKTWKDGGYATTPEEYEMGLLAGKNKFKMPFTANHNMTMNPKGMPISFPVYYEGLINGMQTDSGVALPGQDFQVYGDEVREYPMYQTGGNLNRLAPRAVNVRSDYKYNPNGDNVPSFSPQKQLRRGVSTFKIPADYGKPKGIDDRFIMKDDSNPLPLKVSDEKPLTYTYEKLKGKKGGYLKDKNTYVTKDGKETRRGIWSNTYLKKKREGKLQRGGDANKYGTIPQGEWDAIYGPSAPVGDKPSFLSKVKDTVKSALTTDENYDPYKVQSFDVPYASTAYNLARAAEGPDKELVRTNPYQSEVINTAKYNRVRPNFRPIEMAQNKLASQVRGSVSSVPSMMSNMQNVTSNTQRNMADAALQAANQNAQLTANYANTLSQEGWRTAQEQGRVDDLDRRNEASYFAHLASVAAGVDSARKQQRVLGDADRFTDMELTATNATASDVKFVRLPNGRLVQYYRDPITGEFKPVELKGLG